eukprot:scaffold58917_cov62-Attheya_sp.AAC.4
MNDNSKKLIVEDDDKEADDDEDHEKNGDRSTVKMSLIDAYDRRLLPESWLHDTPFALAKFRPWAGENEEAWSGYDWESKEGQQCIIEEWQEFIEEVQASDQPIPDRLQHKIDWYARNSKELESDGQFGESDDYIYVAGAESGNNEEFAVEWRKDHDFSVLEEDYGPDVADVFDWLSSTYDSIVENLHGVTTRAERPLISEEQMSCFNEQQCLAHDTIVRATTTDKIDRKLIVLIGLGWYWQIYYR